MFSLTHEPLDAHKLAAPLEDVRAGALATFEGRVRNHNEGREVLALEYEAYEALAVAEGKRLVEEAIEKTGAISARCVHRVGRLELGEAAVWIGVAGAHRKEALKACEYIIEELKKRVPIWKKEHYADGESGWVNADGSART
jgi:molybdopterin synthase catalytic subunit